MFDLLLRFISWVDNKARVRGFLRPRLEQGGSLLPDFDLDVPWLQDVEVVQLRADEQGLELGPRSLPFRAWAPPPGLPAALTAWWGEIVEQQKSPDLKFIETLHELYLGRVSATVEPQDGLARGLAAATPNDNLLVALRTMLPEDWDTDDTREIEEFPPALIGALSGLVFEASIDANAWRSAALPTGSARFGLHRDANVETEINVLRVEQRADGFRLTLLDRQGQVLRRDRATWHEIELRRGLGPSQTHPQIHRRTRTWINHRSELDDVHAIDAMGATEQVGHQLWWNLKVIDVHGRTIHEGDAIDIRERLDPPPTPEAVRFEWRVGDDEATLTVALPDSTDPRDQLELAVYVKRRPLDACGYYGDADDIALLEGNRVLDLDASEQLDPPPTGDGKKWSEWLECHEAWDPRWARLGLERVPDDRISVVEKRRQLKIRRLGELAGREGLRFFVASERRVASGVLESLPTPAEHVLLTASGERHMFQVEVIPKSAPAGRRFASVHGSGGPQLWGEAIKSKVLLSWRHQDPRDDEPPVGGYRIWMRDPVALGDPVPWRPVLEVQALPPVLATLRQLPGLGEARWSISAAVANVDGAAATLPREQGIEAAIQKATANALHLLDDRQAHEDAPDKPEEQLLDDLRRAYEAATTGDGNLELAKAAWHSAILGALDAQGRIRRFRLPLDSLTGKSKDVIAILEQLRTQSVAWAYARDPEKHPYATVLAIALPGRADIWEPLFAGPVLTLDELAGSRRTLTWDEQRRIELVWEGIEDRWHHDTQWAIEIRERYAELRQQLDLPADPQLTESTLAPEAIEEARVLTVIVERSEPVDERVAVVPELAEHDDWISFRLLPPPAWQQAAHNAVNRTRLGHLHIDIERRAGWPLASDYQRVLAASNAGQELGSWQDAARAQGAPAALFYEFPRSDPAREPSVHDGSTLIFDRDTPYYYKVELGARLMADSEVGFASWASATRSPRRLGLPAVPRWQIADNGGAPRTFRLTFELFTPLLASHLDTLESKNIEAEATADSWLFQCPDRFVACPIHLLPDLELELFIYLDLGAPGLPALLPAFCWRGPLASGASPRASDAAVDARSLGFEVVKETMAPFLAGLVDCKASRGGMVTTLAIDSQPYQNLAEEVQERLEKLMYIDDTNPFWARLRRGARWTSPFPLARKDGERSKLGRGWTWNS